MYTTVTEGLDLSDEAEATALETIERYAAAIWDGKGDAVVAAAEVANAVSLALSSSGSTTVAASIATSIETNVNGTTDAGDVFIVGEEGPELIVGKSGSTVFPADETERIINAVTSNDDNRRKRRPAAPTAGTVTGGAPSMWPKAAECGRSAPILMERKENHVDREGADSNRSAPCFCR